MFFNNLQKNQGKFDLSLSYPFLPSEAITQDKSSLTKYQSCQNHLSLSRRELGS